jgi:hypothetical protein
MPSIQRLVQAEATGREFTQLHRCLMLHIGSGQVGVTALHCLNLTPIHACIHTECGAVWLRFKQRHAQTACITPQRLHTQCSRCASVLGQWDYTHNGAVLPLPSAPEGHGADGVDAMA